MLDINNLQKWLSVDPMSDKYPSMSPYNYCLNNPLINIDPDGRDNYTINSEGKVEWVDNKTKEGVDILTYIDSKGKLGESITLKEGICHSLVGPSEEGQRSSTMAIKNRDQMFDLFKFLGRNTDVEWAMLGVFEDDRSVDYLYTNHSDEYVNADRFEWAVDNKYLAYFAHSHTNYVPNKWNVNQFDYETPGHRNYGAVLSRDDYGNLARARDAGLNVPFFLYFRGELKNYEKTEKFPFGRDNSILRR